MAFTVKQLLTNSVIHGIERKAGLQERDPEITWVNVMEILDSPHTVESGELLITTGYGLNDEARYRNLIPTLKQRNVSGLLLQPGYYIQDIPEYILRAADELDFPILSIPAELSFSELLHRLIEEIEGDKDPDFKHYRELKTLTLKLPEDLSIENRQLFLICPAGTGGRSVDVHKGLAKIHSYLSSLTREICYITNALGCAIYICETTDNLNVYKAIAHDLNMKLLEAYEEFGCNFYVGAEEYSERQNFDTMFERASSGLNTLSQLHARRGACTYDNTIYVESFGRLYRQRRNQLEDNSILQMLINYDRLHQTEYVNTIQIYLASSCNLARTSERLYIHRHTLMNRLKTIKDLFGLDFTDHYARVYMSVDMLLRDYYTV